eukprot:352395-Chlamydomonas_euryale.AAC.1
MAAAAVAAELDADAAERGPVEADGALAAVVPARRIAAHIERWMRQPWVARELRAQLSARGFMAAAAVGGDCDAALGDGADACDDDVTIVDERQGAGGSQGAGAGARKRRRMKQTQLAVGDDGMLSTQGVTVASCDKEGCPCRQQPHTAVWPQPHITAVWQQPQTAAPHSRDNSTETRTRGSASARECREGPVGVRTRGLVGGSLGGWATAHWELCALHRSEGLCVGLK